MAVALVGISAPGILNDRLQPRQDRAIEHINADAGRSRAGVRDVPRGRALIAGLAIASPPGCGVSNRHGPPACGAASEAVAQDADLRRAVLAARAPDIPGSGGVGAFRQRRVQERREVDEVLLVSWPLLALGHAVR